MSASKVEFYVSCKVSVLTFIMADGLKVASDVEPVMIPLHPGWFELLYRLVILP